MNVKIFMLYVSLIKISILFRCSDTRNIMQKDFNIASSNVSQLLNLNKQRNKRDCFIRRMFINNYFIIK